MMVIMAQKTITIMKEMNLVSTPRLSLQSPPTQG